MQSKNVDMKMKDSKLRITDTEVYEPVFEK